MEATVELRKLWGAFADGSRKIQTVLGWRPEFNNLNTICDTAYRWEKRLLNGDVAPSAPV